MGGSEGCWGGSCGSWGLWVGPWGLKWLLKGFGWLLEVLRWLLRGVGWDPKGSGGLLEGLKWLPGGLGLVSAPPTPSGDSAAPPRWARTTSPRPPPGAHLLPLVLTPVLGGPFSLCFGFWRPLRTEPRREEVRPCSAGGAAAAGVGPSTAFSRSTPTGPRKGRMGDLTRPWAMSLGKGPPGGDRERGGTGTRCPPGLLSAPSA